GPRETHLRVMCACLALLEAAIVYVVPASPLYRVTLISDARFEGLEPPERRAPRLVVVEGLAEITEDSTVMAGLIAKFRDPSPAVRIDLAKSETLSFSER